jgi:hypothetical protein
MSIWQYDGQTKDALLSVMRTSACAYCGNDLWRPQPIVDEKPWGDKEEWRVRVCQNCGWWKITKIDHLEEGVLYRGFRSPAAGSLKTLDLTDITTPMDEVRQFLIAQYQSRFLLAPSLFEEAVASVFRDVGFRAFVTGRSGDGGIDILLHDSADKVIGVQVKRYHDAIEVSQIRELLGALVVRGLTQGLFVTTSRFRSGAVQTLQSASREGFHIELIDGDGFYRALRLTRRPVFEPPDVQFLIGRAAYTPMSDTGTRDYGIGAIYNPERLKGWSGPGGPQDDWP